MLSEVVNSLFLNYNSIQINRSRNKAEVDLLDVKIDGKEFEIEVFESENWGTLEITNKTEPLKGYMFFKVQDVINFIKNN